MTEHFPLSLKTGVPEMTEHFPPSLKTGAAEMTEYHPSSRTTGGQRSAVAAAAQTIEFPL
jgi:hypothetical protein